MKKGFWKSMGRNSNSGTKLLRSCQLSRVPLRAMQQKHDKSPEGNSTPQRLRNTITEIKV